MSIRLSNNREFSPLLRAIAALVTVASCVGLSANAQPSTPPVEQRKPPVADGELNQDSPPPPSATSLRERLATRLGEMVRMQERVKQAIARLDAGDPVTDVMRDFGPLTRQILRGGEMGGRREGGEGFEGRGEEFLDGNRRNPNGGGRGGAMLSPEERVQVLAVIKEHSPELAKQIETLEANPGPTGRAMAGRLWHRLRDVVANRERSPELFKIKLHEIENGGRLIQAVRIFRESKSSLESTAEATSKAEAKVRELLLEQYEIKARMRAIEIDELTKRLESMRLVLNSKQGDKAQIVAEMFDNLMREDARGAGKANRPRPPAEDDGAERPRPRRGPENTPPGAGVQRDQQPPPPQ